MNRLIAFALAGAMLLLTTGFAHGALNAYLKMKGVKTKSFNPEVPSGILPVQADLASIVSPRDAASGLPTGKRQHKPITVTRPVDKSTPIILKALVTNEVLQDVELRFFQAAPGGQVRLTRMATLKNARISNIRKFKAPDLNGRGGEVAMEEITLVHEGIEWKPMNAVVPDSAWKSAGLP